MKQIKIMFATSLKNAKILPARVAKFSNILEKVDGFAKMPSRHEHFLKLYFHTLWSSKIRLSSSFLKWKKCLSTLLGYIAREHSFSSYILEKSKFDVDFIFCKKSYRRIKGPFWLWMWLLGQRGNIPIEYIFCIFSRASHFKELSNNEDCHPFHCRYVWKEKRKFQRNILQCFSSYHRIFSQNFPGRILFFQSLKVLRKEKMLVGFFGGWRLWFCWFWSLDTKSLLSLPNFFFVRNFLTPFFLPRFSFCIHCYCINLLLCLG